MEVTIEHFIQGGAVGIAVLLIWLIYKIFTHCNKTTNRIVEVVEQNAKAMTKLVGSIDVNTAATNNMNNGIKSMADVARDAMSLKRRTKL